VECRPVWEAWAAAVKPCTPKAWEVVWAAAQEEQSVIRIQALLMKEKSGGDVLTEEFGAVAGAAGMGGMGMGMPGGEGYSGGSSAASMASPSGMGGGKAAAKKEVRYVDDAEKDQGYKTRAFLLDVIVRDERLPDLLAKLTNSDFPVEIRSR
jgi:hypothetical protein